MKDLHIVIVNWNTRDELERCLKSLPDACWDLDWECVVVDNGSSDGSVEMFEQVFANEYKMDLLTNKYNSGFAAACNQGAVQHKSRNILLLNPDTVCPPYSLTELVRRMDLNTHVGIMGPKLLNSDGSYQQSVRHFPTLISQAVILLKLHHLLPWLPSLKKYFADNIDPNKPQEVDQVMGACFLVRAECWDQMRGLDKSYFIWFEEVDACKIAKQNGWLVWYEPSIAIMHHGGRAFAKAMTLKKQRYFNDSLKKYMLKWRGLPAWLIICILHPISLLLAAGVSIYKKLGSSNSMNRDYSGADLEREKKFDVNQANKKAPKELPCRRDAKEVYYWFAGIGVLELLSFAGHYLTMPVLSNALPILALLAIAIIAYKRPGLALAIVGAEVWIGGFGYLFMLTVPNLAIGLSLRMVLMGGFFLGWGLNAVVNKIWKQWNVTELFIILAWLFVATMVFSGFINGLHLNQPFIFQDANAWVFLFYLIPVLDIAHRYPIQLSQHAKSAFVASVIWLPLKALVVFYIFSHGITTWADPLYTWIRDTKVGEITPAGGNLYRVFFQSAIFSLATALYLMAYWIQTGVKSLNKNKFDHLFSALPCYLPRYAVISLWMLSIAMVLISLSRSFWVGMTVGLIVCLFLGIIKFKKIPWLALGKLIAGIFAAFVLVITTMYLPWPKTDNISLASMLKDRGTVSDAAGASRWHLLPAMMDKIRENPIIGHGFGSTVTYKSLDPRVLEQNPDGIYTTYAFEWGWLSLWLKFGIFGPLVMLWLLVSNTWRSYKSNYSWWIRTGIIATTTAFAVVHIFTPYLNHPIGFTFLLTTEGMLVMARNNNRSIGKQGE